MKAHINPVIAGRRPSATLAINEHANRLKAAGQTIYKFGLGQSPFPVATSVVEALKAHAHQKDYLPVAGLPALCETVAAYYKRTQGLAFDAENIMIGPGSKELMYILQLVFNCRLLLPAPSWVSYEPQAKIIQRPVEWLPTLASDGWRLTPETLEAHCKQKDGLARLLILNYPNNPTGVSYSAERLQALAKVARKHRILLLSDEIYGELDFSGGHCSIARYYPEGTIVSGGLSKWCGAGGWRLGIFAFPRELSAVRKAMAVVASETFTSVSAPIQYAAVRAYEGSADIDLYLRQSRYILKNLADWIFDRLLNAGVHVVRPDGAFYMFPDFAVLKDGLMKRGIYDVRQLCDRLLKETGVALLPGTDFGRGSDEWLARLAYVDFDGAAALKALQGSVPDRAMEGPFLMGHFGHLLQGIDKMCGWLDLMNK